MKEKSVSYLNGTQLKGLLPALYARWHKFHRR